MTRLLILLSLSLFCSSCKDSSSAASPNNSQTTETINYRTLTYFHGSHENYDKVILEFSTNQSTINQFASSSDPVEVDRSEMEKLLDDFNSLSQVDKFLDDTGSAKDTLKEYIIKTFTHDYGFKTYVIPIKDAHQNDAFQKWLKRLQIFINKTKSANKSQ